MSSFLQGAPISMAEARLNETLAFSMCGLQSRVRDMSEHHGAWVCNKCFGLGSDSEVERVQARVAAAGMSEQGGEAESDAGGTSDASTLPLSGLVTPVRVPKASRPVPPGTSLGGIRICFRLPIMLGLASIGVPPWVGILRFRLVQAAAAVLFFCHVCHSRMTPHSRIGSTRS